MYVELVTKRLIQQNQKNLTWLTEIQNPKN